MRSQKLEHSNANLSLISTEKLTIHRYVDAASVALSFTTYLWKQMCGGYLSIREKKGNIFQTEIFTALIFNLLDIRR
ncbi:hypothetical protein ALC60_12329 [Trachymyrmex zeteki]|uniref:Uncharacterized protein n=1 Tax=Mycetomoellerius zeteki TaxID=64791 RepID=A0A151WL84_9HYME|nr:hypothetical protein ALC60_12329 [Trachymyrmex zeteki]